MNLRQPKLAKLVDSSKSMALHSVIHDLDKYKEMVQALLDKHQELLVYHYTKENIIENIHKITTMEDLMNFEVAVVPREAMDVVAQSIDEMYPKEPMYMKVQLYLEIIQQMNKGGGDYIRENLRQRMQYLANQQAQETGKIIVPKSIIT